MRNFFFLIEKRELESGQKKMVYSYSKRAAASEICGVWGVVLGVVLSGQSVFSDTDPGVLFFEKNIRPLLIEHCYDCHSAGAGTKTKGGLALDTRDGWRKGGDSGPALKPGKPEESLLYIAVTYKDADFQMPEKYRLADSEIQTIRKWIEMGAPDPRDGTPAVMTADRSVITDSDRQFWSFVSPRMTTLPSVVDRDWPDSEMDSFILSKLETKHLTPVADADRETLIRRATFDLIGLPPRPDEIQAFQDDQQDDRDAFAVLVDRLLASKEFGVRWGRHWMDIVRYAESVGRTRNYPFPFAWRYRDYVIDSFNSDKPYNQFIKEQIAGDLLPFDSVEEQNRNRIATGFLALGSQDLNERNLNQYLMNVADEQIDTTSRVFMALTTGCARCHDHKFDPIPTADYYALAGIFRSTDLKSGYMNRQGGNKGPFKPEHLVSLTLDESEFRIAGQVEVEVPTKKMRGRLNRLKKELKAVQKRGVKKKRVPRKKNTTKAEKNIVEPNADSLRNAGLSRREKQKRISGLRRQIKKLERDISGQENAFAVKGDFAMGVSERKKPIDCRINVRGDAANLGDRVPRGFLRVIHNENEVSIPPGQSGRLELAEWIASEDHALTARVMVNRIWHHLFGRGLVRTVDNFGSSGSVPTHPELLDHLAVKFMEDGWSVKGMIRRIMLSRAYRMSSEHQEKNYAVDPDNTLLWRMTMRRLEVEAIRDAILAVSGNLDLEPPENGSVVAGFKPGEIGRNKGTLPDWIQMNHRSVYLPVVRNFLPDMFETFDFAEPSSVIGRRDVTTVSTQALFMLNSAFILEAARNTAKRVMTSGTLSAPEKVDWLYLRALGRHSSKAETQRVLTYIDMAASGKNVVDAWAGFCQTLFASAEFRYLQ